MTQNGPLVIQCSGFIEGCDFSDLDNLYCRYSFLYGHDWSILGGVDTGISQTSIRNTHFNQDIVWNFPIDITFKSTNVHGWPRISISVYGLDYLGRDVVRGYGSLLIPIGAGSYVLSVDMYRPLAASPLNNIMSWIFGDPPEFYDTKFVSQGEGREVTRVQRSGIVKVILNIKTKGTDFEFPSFPSFLKLLSSASLGFTDAGYSIEDMK